MNFTKEQLDALAKKHGGRSIEIVKASTDENLQAIVDPFANFAAKFRLHKKDYPQLEKATIIITEKDDKCIVAVKALGCLPDGSWSWFGDICEMSKNEPISKLFDGLKSTFENVETLIQDPDKGV